MTNISITKLHEFKDHPYNVLDNDEMNSLIESVQEHGIMSPLIVRLLEGTTDEYEIISGHRRFRAAQKAGLTTVPAFIRPVSRDKAAFKHTGRKENNTSFPTCVKKILNSDFTHLSITEEDDTIIVKNVCSTVGKEDNIAVEEETT